MFSKFERSEHPECRCRCDLGVRLNTKWQYDKTWASERPLAFLTVSEGNVRVYRPVWLKGSRRVSHRHRTSSKHLPTCRNFETLSNGRRTTLDRLVPGSVRDGGRPLGFIERSTGTGELR